MEKTSPEQLTLNLVPDIRPIAERLFTTAHDINLAKDRLRLSCSRVAGCWLQYPYWTIEDLMRYADLAIKTHADDSYKPLLP